MRLDRTISALVDTESRIDLDHGGEQADWDIPQGAADVVVVVEPVTEALKLTSMGGIAGSVDRDMACRVIGISVDARVALQKPASVTSVDEWVDHFRDTATPFDVIERNDAP